MKNKKNQNEVLIINPGSTKVKKVVFYDEKFDGIGIRVVHGGGLQGPIRINKKVKDKIKEALIFAPIHNKLALKEINLLEKKYPQKNIWAVFDTDFHQTIPEENYTLSIDRKIAKKYKLRKYGFHGLVIESIISVLKKSTTSQRKNKLASKIICVHLGGGSSITAVKNGKSIFNTMGVTPLSGLMGKTRSGYVDADIFKILDQQGLSVNKISEILSYKSGFLGLTGSTDTRKIIEKAKAGSKKEKLAYEIYLKQIVNEIFGAYGLLQGCDILTLSGGIGFNNEYIKDDLYKRIKILGIKKSQIKRIKIDEEKVIFEKIRKL